VRRNIPGVSATELIAAASASPSAIAPRRAKGRDTAHLILPNMKAFLSELGEKPMDQEAK
jgi:hypothetical protein